MKLDLHIHTQNSDGQYTVEEIVMKLIKEGINIFSITDHDNVNSCIQMEQIILPKYFKYIPGVELSAILNNKYNCHILGYNIDYRSEFIQNQCEKIKINKLHRMLNIIDYLYDQHKIAIPETEKKKLFEKDRPIGRSELCQVLIKLLNLSQKDIFEKYLANVPKVEEHRISAEDTINTIHKAKGHAILAHPKEIELEYNIMLEDIIYDLLEMGIDGIEISNSIHELKDVRRYLLIAKKYGLLTTAGSDYHGDRLKPEIELGKTTIMKKDMTPNDINYIKKILPSSRKKYIKKMESVF